MKIVKCLKCGKYIHKADKCFHCGNTIGFDEIERFEIHENVVGEYLEIESLVKNKKFNEAISLSYTVIEWMPVCPEVFWLRLLAKNKCTSDVELIKKGFDCENDEDLYNALTFSNGVEHDVYLDVRNMVFKARKVLKEAVLNNEYNCKMNTDILLIKKNIPNEMDVRKKNLFSLLSNLEETEHRLYILEMECRLLSKEYCDEIDSAAQAAASIKAEVCRLKECSERNLHKYHIKIENTLQQFEQTKAKMESMKKQHPCVKIFNDLVKKRDEQVRIISNEISSLRTYEATIQRVLNEIDRIEERHRQVIRKVEAYDFLDAVNLLGENCYNNIFRNIGVE